MMDWQNLIQQFSECELEVNKIIVKSRLKEIISFVSENYAFDILYEIIAVDKKELGVELIYRLYSTTNEEDALISIMVKEEAESVVDIFASAQADENEIFDLFGIKFLGNKNLKRLYMPEDWKGFPLRKDYVQDDTRLVWDDDDKNA